MTVNEFLSELTLDQLKYVKEQANEKIKLAEKGEKKIVWRISNGFTIDGDFKEEDYEKASSMLVSIFKKKFDEEAADFIKNKRSNIYYFKDNVPSIIPERVTQFEYDTEWFPS